MAIDYVDTARGPSVFAHKTSPVAIGTYIKRALLEWEVMRFFYNILLLGQGLMFLWDLRRLGERADHLCPNVFGPGVWSAILVFGLTANVLYCLGPLIDIVFAVAFRRPLRHARYALFVAVLFLSMLLILLLWLRGVSHIGGYLQ